jgi:hypothetical protein
MGVGQAGMVSVCRGGGGGLLLTVVNKKIRHVHQLCGRVFFRCAHEVQSSKDVMVR